MKRALALLVLLLMAAAPAHAFEVLAIGTSATNCRGVDRDKTYPAKLQEILRRDGLADATVINAGIDGDRPAWMFKRLPAAITPNTRLVILEPGPNDPDPDYAREYAEKMLALLSERKMPTIYVSSKKYETEDQAAAMAAKYGAAYYGNLAKGVPHESKFWQGDNDKQFGGVGKGWGGHMTAAGCLLAAQGIAPLAEQVLREKRH
jgi:hypothetical protein